MANDLIVRILGDTKGLERSFAKANQATATFGRNVDSVGTKLDTTTKRFRGLSGAAGGFAGAIALGATVQGIRTVAAAAAESQQVLGQTQVALETTGKSWSKYGDTIEDAVQAQSKLGFDDEALLRTFSLFVRTTGEVGEALRLNNLAMDVARARFIDLEQAAQLVNKAAIGQGGALRRLGIDVKANASATELLTALTEKYGGAAVAASGDAQASFDRLNVAIENAQESIGRLLLPKLTDMAEGFAKTVDNVNRLTDALGRLSDVGPINVVVNLIERVIPGGDGSQSQLGKAFGIILKGSIFEIINLGVDAALGEGIFAPEAEKKLTSGIQAHMDQMVKNAVENVKPFGITKLPTRGENLGLQFKSGIDKAIDMAQGLAKSAVAEGQERIQAEKAREAAEKAAVALKKRNEALAKLEEQRRIALQQRQFRALGLSGSGQEIVPGVENLRKQLASLSERLAGSDVTSKLTNRLDGVRKLLSGKFGKLTEETRRAINDLFSAIRQEFDKGDDSLKKGPLTKTSSLNANRILEGLGLTPEAERELRARLSSFNSAGQSLSRATRPTGNFQSQPLEVTVNSTTNLDGQTVAQNQSKYQQKTRRRNPRQKRGPRSGI